MRRRRWARRASVDAPGALAPPYAAGLSWVRIVERLEPIRQAHEEARIRTYPPRWTVPYFGLCFLAQIWPLAGAANRIEPQIAGLPFFLSWYVIWVLLIFVGLLLLYRMSSGTPTRREAASAPPHQRDPSEGGDPGSGDDDSVVGGVR